MKLTEDQWKFLYGLRDDMADEEDRAALRRLIRRAEQSERRVEAIKRMVRQWFEFDGDGGQ
jgi:hypothetical protein